MTFGTEVMERETIQIVHNATIDAIKELGVRHIRSLHHNEVSSFVRTNGQTYHAFEFDVQIKFDLHEIGVKSFHDNVKAEISALMDKRNINNGMESFADVRSPAQVVAMREPIVTRFVPPPHDLRSVYHIIVALRISFYDQCDHYLSAQSGEKIYVSELIRAEDAKSAEPADNSFTLALEALHEGLRVARHSWKEISYILLVPGSPKLTVDAGRPLARAGVPVGTEFTYAPHIDAFRETSDVPVFGAWTPTQEDILAKDWYVVRED